MKQFVRWVSIVLGALVALVVLLVIGIYFRSEQVINKVYAAPPAQITIDQAAAAIARGEHLATAVSVCVDCHGANLAGGVVMDDPAIGRIVAPNLTTGAGGIGGQRTDADLLRVLRYGVKADGHSALVMPSANYQYLSDADLAAILAYLRSVPPQTSTLPLNELRPLGRILLTLDQLPILVAKRIDPHLQPPTSVAESVSVEYGQYLAQIAGCADCHGASFAGGPIPAAPPDWPAASNVTPGGEVGQWDEADFINTIRTGINPAGKTLDQRMPWLRYRNMTDAELKALWLFIQALPAKAYGSL